jgi:translation initiation factor 2B subunit (eIF-2B alpha/beta/delta family)
VVTHSASATVREAVLHTPPKLLVCTVSHPVEEGRAFAAELRASGLAVELVEDEDAPAELARASLLLVGADTVFRDGTLCNKIGTRMLAEAAAEQQVPTIVACEVIKLAPIESTTAPELAREERELFDLTPPELLHAVVTEEGTVRSDEVQRPGRPHPVPAPGLRVARANSLRRRWSTKPVRLRASRSWRRRPGSSG